MSLDVDRRRILNSLQSVYSIYQAVKQQLRQWSGPNHHTPTRSTIHNLIRSESEPMIENTLLRR